MEQGGANLSRRYAIIQAGRVFHTPSPSLFANLARLYFKKGSEVMSKTTKTKEDMCYDCNIFQESCNGRTLFKPNTETGKCMNQVTTAENTPSPIQVHAFRSLYKTKVSMGMNSDEAFVEAIAQTSDSAYEQALKTNPNEINEYMNRNNNP